MGFLDLVKKSPINSIAIGLAGLAVVAAGSVMIADRAKYAAYEDKYNKEQAELLATFPAKPKAVALDNDFLKFDEDGGKVVKSKSKYKKDFTFYARDAAIAPANSDVAQEYVKIDDTYLGEAISGLDRKGGAVSFSILTKDHGYSDIDVALRTNWVDDDGKYVEMKDLSSYIKIQVNGLEVDASSIDLSDSREFSHFIMKDTFLLKGENTVTFTTSAYNPYKNKETYLYVMPDIRNLTVMTDVDVYLAEYEVNADEFPTSYRLCELPDVSKIKVTKRLGNPEDAKHYKEENGDGSKYAYSIDYANSKVLLKCSPKSVQAIDVTIDKSASSNTFTGTLSNKDASIVLTSENEISATIDGKSCTAKVSLSGKGLARIKVLEKLSGDDEAFAALPKSIGIEDDNGTLKIVTTRYYMSTTKANTGTGGTTGPSQTGNTYFAINCEEYLTAFWNWTWNGDEALCLKCTYTMNGSSITLNSCLEYNTRDEWQYLSNKTFTVQAISYDDIPTNLTSKSHFVIYAD